MKCQGFTRKKMENVIGENEERQRQRETESERVSQTET